MTLDSSIPKPILLSILIPAYKYAAGVDRILRQLGSGPRPSYPFEIIISDDSPSTDIQEVAEPIGREFGLPLQYIHNVPALGAPNNWNSLLRRARGTYAWLLHHDEFPIEDDFLSRLGVFLEQPNGAPEALVFDCVLVDQVSGAHRHHVPSAVRDIVLRLAPWYLLRRNVVGPASALIVQREHYPLFEPQLRWLVDVDVYQRLFSAGVVWIQADGLHVGSLLGRDDSITAGLRGRISGIQDQELQLLTAKHSINRWAWFLDPDSKTGKLARFIESTVWGMFRITTRAAGFLWTNRLARDQMLKIIHANSNTPSQ